MAQDGDGRERGRAPASLRSETGADSLDAPPSESGDYLLRAAAQIDEPSASKVSAYAAGAPAAQLQAGAVIAKRYRLERELGRGGMGVVWEATHLVTRRRVAIKFVIGPAHRRGDLSRRFLREARAASGPRRRAVGCTASDLRAVGHLATTEGPSGDKRRSTRMALTASSRIESRKARDSPDRSSRGAGAVAPEFRVVEVAAQDRPVGSCSQIGAICTRTDVGRVPVQVPLRTLPSKSS